MIATFTLRGEQAPIPKGKDVKKGKNPVQTTQPSEGGIHHMHNIRRILSGWPAGGSDLQIMWGFLKDALLGPYLCAEKTLTNPAAWWYFTEQLTKMFSSSWDLLSWKFYQVRVCFMKRTVWRAHVYFQDEVNKRAECPTFANNTSCSTCICYSRTSDECTWRTV